MATLFERGAFTAADSFASAEPLIAYGFGLPAFVLIKVLVPGFFAAENTKTPVKVATFCIFINLPLTWLFVHYFPNIGLNSATGIATATTISAWVNAGTLFALLRGRGQVTLLAHTKRNSLLALLIALVMGASVWALSLHFNAIPKVTRAPALCGLIALAVVLYFGFGYALKVYTLSGLKKWLKARQKNGNSNEDGRK